MSGVIKKVVRVAGWLALVGCLVPVWGTAGTGSSIERGLWLITPEEAALPAAPTGGVAPSGGRPLDVERAAPDTGPEILVVKPAEGKPLSVPLEVAVRFKPRQAPVEVATVKVSVVKLFEIDITERVRPYVTPAGIEIPDARLPSGKHMVRISVGDKNGGVSQRELTLEVL